jgi:hypothetical protein
VCGAEGERIFASLGGDLGDDDGLHAPGFEDLHDCEAYGAAADDERSTRSFVGAAGYGMPGYC